MSFNIPRNPNDMDKKEVFDTIQQLQKAAESLGQQYTMYTKTTLPKGKQPTVDDMHEEAARQQLTALYNNQNKAPTTKPEGQQVAQVTPQVTKGMSQGFQGSPEASINALGIRMLDQAETRTQIRQLADTGISEEDFIIQNNPNKAALEIFRQRVQELSPTGK